MLVRARQTLLLVVDVILLYATLFLVLLVRYGKINSYLINAHIGPFSAVFILWLIIFYIVGLYDIRSLKKGYEIFQQLLVAISVGTAIAVTMFYLISSFHISPKTSLAMFAVFFGIIESGWRYLFKTWSPTSKKNVLIIGSGKDVEGLEKFMFENPQIGYKVSFQIQETQDAKSEMIRDVIKKENINTVVIDHKAASASNLFDELYRYMAGGVEIVTLAAAYEAILKKLPVSEVRDFSLVTEMSRSRRIYEAVKKPLEFLIALVLFVMLVIPMALIYVLIRLTSRGVGIYKQTRVGKNEREFVLYKFRTMKANAEDNGPEWSLTQDSRVTAVGRLLRYTHLDELPQLWNILKGDISFVGPRPERPEFVKNLKEKIPYYEIRHMIKPGITGWAQVNFKYGSSIEDAMGKLQFDLFYIKNRSITLDALIILKTIKMFIFNYS
jgi:exopolysaccharide biosynthesis polyprenyl glycosylphosphotransferase